MSEASDEGGSREVSLDKRHSTASAIVVDEAGEGAETTTATTTLVMNTATVTTQIRRVSLSPVGRRVSVVGSPVRGSPARAASVVSIVRSSSPGPRPKSLTHKDRSASPQRSCNLTGLELAKTCGVVLMHDVEEHSFGAFHGAENLMIAVGGEHRTSLVGSEEATEKDADVGGVAGGVEVDIDQALAAEADAVAAARSRSPSSARGEPYSPTVGRENILQATQVLFCRECRSCRFSLSDVDNMRF